MTKENRILCSNAIWKAALESMKNAACEMVELCGKTENMQGGPVFQTRVNMVVTLGNILGISMSEREAEQLCGEVWDIAERKTRMKLKRAVYFARKEEGKMARIMTEMMGWLVVQRLESREAGDG